MNNTNTNTNTNININTDHKLDHTLKSIITGLNNKTFSSQEIITDYLNKIKIYNTNINGYIHVDSDYVIQNAKLADQARAEHFKNNTDPMLTGTPIAHKDIFCTSDAPTTCGSKMLQGFMSPVDAHLVNKGKEHGLITLGKLNMDEFAMGSSNETSFYGAVKNPWGDNLTPGGSSGGSAAVVAAGLAPAATGTDTGGSIRQPAAFCGITGLKPTYGRVSRFGMIAFASSLDTAGPLTKTAEDAAILLNIMAGHDPKDTTSAQRPTEDYTKSLNNDLTGLKIGIPRSFFEEGLDNNIATQTLNAIKEYEKMGATCIDINLPHNKYSLATYYIIAPAEASANLSRFDGVRYGYRCENPKDLTDLYSRTRQEGFGIEVKRRIMMGAYALSSGYYDAYYIKAQRIRRLISEDYQKAFQKVDVIMAPTTPSTAFELNKKFTNPVEMYLNDIYTLSVNLAGIPAISIPCGMVNNLPIGLQIIGNHFEEAKLLNIAHKFQTQTDWHTKQPILKTN